MTINIKRTLISAAVLLAASTLAMASAASAEMRPGPPPAAVVGTTNGSGEAQTTKLLAEQLKDQAKSKLAAQKQSIKQKTQAERQKACTARKNNLAKRMANAVSWAQKHKGVIDTAYSRVTTFHDSKSLEVTDYDNLTATVDAAQSTAQTSIDALGALDVDIDCTSQTVAVSVSTFQQSVKNTRDSLKSYRDSLVKLIEALKGASTAAGTGTSANGAGE